MSSSSFSSSVSSSYSSSGSSSDTDSDHAPVSRSSALKEPTLKKSTKTIEERVDLDSDSDEYNYEHQVDDCPCLSCLNGGPKLCHGWKVFRTTDIYRYSRQIDAYALNNAAWYLPLFLVAIFESMLWLIYFLTFLITTPIWVAFSSVSLCGCCKIKGFSAWIQAAVAFPMNIFMLPFIIMRCCCGRR